MSQRALVLLLVLFLLAIDWTFSKQAYVSAAIANGDLRPCYARGVSNSSVEVPAILETPTSCSSEAKGRIPYKLHFERYPYCQNLCPSTLTPQGCSLAQLSPSRLVSALSGRRLVLWGDSVTQMHWDFLVRVLLQNCLRRPTRFESRVAPAKGKRSRGRQYAERGGYCRPLVNEKPGSPACIQVRACGAEKEGGNKGSESLEICYVQAYTGILLPHTTSCMGHLRSGDVVLFNNGLHYQPSEAREYGRQLRRFRLAWDGVVDEAQRAGRDPPVGIWRETSPQHFDTPGGEFVLVNAKLPLLKHPRSFACSTVPRKSALSRNWRNDAAEMELGSVLPFLRVWALGQGAPELHTQYRVKPDTKTADCTHWCISPHGMYHAWTTLLVNQLAALLPAKQDEQ